jgi:hypothetical protein
MPSQGGHGAGSNEPGMDMQILILVGTVLLSLGTALVTAMGVLSLLLRVMSRLR